MIDYIKNNKVYVIQQTLNWLCLFMYLSIFIDDPSAQRPVWLILLWVATAIISRSIIDKVEKSRDWYKNEYNRMFKRDIDFVSQTLKKARDAK